MQLQIRMASRKFFAQYEGNLNGIDWVGLSIISPCGQSLEVNEKHNYYSDAFCENTSN